MAADANGNIYINTFDRLLNLFKKSSETLFELYNDSIAVFIHSMYQRAVPEITISIIPIMITIDAGVSLSIIKLIVIITKVNAIIQNNNCSLSPKNNSKVTMYPYFFLIHIWLHYVIWIIILANTMHNRTDQMTIAIEQLIKMHDPRCMSIESLNVGRGQAVLSKEQILGAFASAQHHNSVGYDVLMTKYRHDSQAEQRIRSAITDWVNRRFNLKYAESACQLALSMVLERNLPAQINHVSRLLCRYGYKATQVRKNSDLLRAEIKQLEKVRCQPKVTDQEYQVIGLQIATLSARIDAEHQSLKAWATQQAMRSNICPRCSGTGQTPRPTIALCNECGGHGRITATYEHLRGSLANIGAVITAEEWPQYLALVKRCMGWLYVNESTTVSILSSRFKMEIGA
ncbi:TIGR02642 family protein [Brenneria uluponensis]|uniref:TIGR02642 family protein n=1 Tax=Brenneria uluponensis TaxID=3057057 RepID=UPI0028E6F604|nr:TIGR02642 family protein [Brenneria ulupoensis]